MKRKHQGYGDTFYIDEVFIKINGRLHYLWRAIDKEGEVVDVYLQAKRDGAAAKRFFKRSLRSHGSEPMLQSRIYSTWGGTWSGLNIIGISGQVRLLNGAGQLPEIGLRVFAVFRS